MNLLHKQEVYDFKYFYSVKSLVPEHSRYGAESRSSLGAINNKGNATDMVTRVLLRCRNVSTDFKILS